MSRATVVYIVILVAGVAGLWLIVRMGSTLTAPSDLSGVWGVGGEDPALPALLGQTVYVEQSGRYLRLNFERGLQVDLELVGETRPNPETEAGLELRFEGRDWSLAARGSSAAGPLIFRLDGPEQYTFTATRGRPDPNERGDRDDVDPEAQASLDDAADDQTAHAGANAP
jgi:hypothetical protein